MKRFLFTAIAFSTLSGCASTNLTGYVDPAFVDVQFSNVAVYVATSDLGDRERLEHHFAIQASKKDITLMPSIEVMPPTRATDKLEMIEGLSMAGYDGVLLVNMTDSGSTSKIVPIGDSFSTATYYQAGFNATLIDAQSHAIIWHSSSDSSTDGFAGWNALLQSFAYKAVEALIEANLITP